MSLFLQEVVPRLAAVNAALTDTERARLQAACANARNDDDLRVVIAKLDRVRDEVDGDPTMQGMGSVSRAERRRQRQERRERRRTQRRQARVEREQRRTRNRRERDRTRQQVVEERERRRTEAREAANRRAVTRAQGRAKRQASGAAADEAREAIGQGRRTPGDVARDVIDVGGSIVGAVRDIVPGVFGGRENEPEAAPEAPAPTQSNILPWALGGAAVLGAAYLATRGS